jgi:hypothetical protein
MEPSVEANTNLKPTIFNLEEWKEIINFPNYQISSYGNIINKNSNKYLKPSSNGGYLCVSICNENGVRSTKMHRLVAEAFISNP